MPSRNYSINWIQIKGRYESGETAYSIAKDHNVTKQGIENRAKRDGWKKGNGELIQAVTDLPIVADVNKQLATPENLTGFIKNIAQGVPLKTAAIANGMSWDTAKRYLEQDAEFASIVAQHRNAFLARRVQNITDAGDRGDWKADKFLLETAQETKEIFGQAPNQTNIQNIINIER
ncbi:MAG: hypothetical protein MJA83_15805 [Gammaproteobacteria bacterium]|nr:hypothetical protein [Gammaproteobacteria bacterium]